MPSKTTVTCDYCNRDISTTVNSVDYRIQLSSVPIPIHGKRGEVVAVTAMMVYPTFPETLYFCQGRCFWEWAAERLTTRTPPAPRPAAEAP